MMLVQKPISSIQPVGQFIHRRHPSAPPAVIVQPTRTPGLLSLSKPVHSSPKPSPQRQLPSNQRHVKQPSKNVNKHSQVVRAQQQLLSPPAEIIEKKPATAQLIAQQQPRGRSAKGAARDKQSVKRSASQSSIRGKHGRQPSPPLSQQPQESSQAEAPTLNTSNLFDPFLDHTTSPPTMNNTPPALASRPSGKLARRRQQYQAANSSNNVLATPPATPSPVPAKAIPVPRPNTNNNRQNHASNNLSRSDPVRSHMPNRKAINRPPPKRADTVEVFPICDDMTDAGDSSESEDMIPYTPTTPTRGPRTAPLSGRGHAGFPFNLQHSPSPVPMQRSTIGVAAGRKFHKRTPSDGIFSVSSDEDAGIGSVAGSKLSPGVQALFGLIPATPKNNRATPPPAEYSYPSPFSTPIPARAVATYPRSSAGLGMSFAEREAELEREAEKEVKGYFASSLFQNSPSPEELPDPVFV